MRKNEMDPWDRWQCQRKTEERETARYRSYDDSRIGWILTALVIIGMLIFIVCMGSLENEDTAIRALKTQGFSNIQIVDKDFLFVSFKGGGKDDNVRFTAYATNPAGDNVTVYVYAGWPWKGATVRTP